MYISTRGDYRYHFSFVGAIYNRWLTIIRVVFIRQAAAWNEKKNTSLFFNIPRFYYYCRIISTYLFSKSNFLTDTNNFFFFKLIHTGRVVTEPSSLASTYTRWRQSLGIHAIFSEYQNGSPYTSKIDRSKPRGQFYLSVFQISRRVV